MTYFNHFCPTVAPAGCTSEALMLRFHLVIIGNSETRIRVHGVEAINTSSSPDSLEIME